MVTLQLARRIVPRPIKQFLRGQHRQLVFRQAMHGLLTTSAAEIAPDVLRNLVYGWGNESWSAREEYLQEALRCARSSQGPILECGSGLSTLLLGIVAQRTGERVYSLEHDAGWAERIKRSLRRFGITSCTVHHVPLQSFGDYWWYSAPQPPVPAGIALVICDGPPGATPGGRLGLLPRMRTRLQPGCIILLDDAERAEEKEIAARWARELGGTYTVRGTEKPFARIVVPQAAGTSP